MFCYNCGEENPDEAKYCKNCGAILKEEKAKKVEIVEEPEFNQNNHQSTQQTTTTTTSSSSNNDSSTWIGCCCLGLIIVFILSALFGGI